MKAGGSIKGPSFSFPSRDRRAGYDDPMTRPRAAWPQDLDALQLAQLLTGPQVQQVTGQQTVVATEDAKTTAVLSTPFSSKATGTPSAAERLRGVLALTWKQDPQVWWRWWSELVDELQQQLQQADLQLKLLRDSALHLNQRSPAVQRLGAQQQFARLTGQLQRDLETRDLLDLDQQLVGQLLRTGQQALQPLKDRLVVDGQFRETAENHHEAAPQLCGDLEVELAALQGLIGRLKGHQQRLDTQQIPARALMPMLDGPATLVQNITDVTTSLDPQARNRQLSGLMTSNLTMLAALRQVAGLQPGRWARINQQARLQQAEQWPVIPASVTTDQPEPYRIDSGLEMDLQVDGGDPLVADRLDLTIQLPASSWPTFRARHLVPPVGYESTDRTGTITTYRRPADGLFANMMLLDLDIPWPPVATPTVQDMALALANVQLACRSNVPSALRVQVSGVPRTLEVDGQDQTFFEAECLSGLVTPLGLITDASDLNGQMVVDVLDPTRFGFIDGWDGTSFSQLLVDELGDGTNRFLQVIPAPQWGFYIAEAFKQQAAEEQWAVLLSSDSLLWEPMGLVPGEVQQYQGTRAQDVVQAINRWPTNQDPETGLPVVAAQQVTELIRSCLVDTIPGQVNRCWVYHQVTSLVWPGGSTGLATFATEFPSNFWFNFVDQDQQVNQLLDFPTDSQATVQLNSSLAAGVYKVRIGVPVEFSDRWSLELDDPQLAGLYRSAVPVSGFVQRKTLQAWLQDPIAIQDQSNFRARTVQGSVVRRHVEIACTRLTTGSRLVVEDQLAFNAEPPPDMIATNPGELRLFTAVPQTRWGAGQMIGFPKSIEPVHALDVLVDPSGQDVAQIVEPSDRQLVVEPPIQLSNQPMSFNYEDATTWRIRRRANHDMAALDGQLQIMEDRLARWPQRLLQLRGQLAARQIAAEQALLVCDELQQQFDWAAGQLQAVGRHQSQQAQELSRYMREQRMDAALELLRYGELQQVLELPEDQWSQAGQLLEGIRNLARQELAVSSQQRGNNRVIVRQQGSQPDPDMTQDPAGPLDQVPLGGIAGVTRPGAAY